VGLMEVLRQRAARTCPRVVFPEGSDPKIIEASLEVQRLGIARPILVGNRGQISALGPLGHLQIADPAESEEAIQAYAEIYEVQEGLPAKAIARQLRDPLNFAAMMVRCGDAEGMVAGLLHETEAVVLSSQMYIGLATGVMVPSSFMVMDVPGWAGGEDGLILFADCALVVDPTSAELASIALSSAASARALLGWVPRVAMISFSTKGSGTHPDVDKVVRALETARAADPSLLIDGELQVDSAVVPEVSEKKIQGENILRGRANVLIFPDLDAANAAYKLVQRLAGAAAYGPVLQGLARPVSDLSRGATVDDIVGAVTLVAAQV
jgi:phosphate acetyltransferase